MFSQRTVTGTVFDEDDKTIPGVYVTVKGLNIGTVTDANGKYSIDVPEGSLFLVFSYTGMKTLEVEIVNDVLDVTMGIKQSELDEVVVIGYGLIKKSDMTGSVSSVRGDELSKISSSSLENALQGKVSGLQISNVSGEPGVAPVLRLRGVGTLNNASPIFVVDGLILDNINFLNSADIESIEVLKDASATAIYGSRGANGVIIITSKTGKGKEKPVFNLTAEYGIQYLPNKIKLLSGYNFAKVVNEINPGTFNNLKLVPNTDWQDEVFNSFAPTSNIQFSFAGSSKDKFEYYFGLGNYNQEGIIPKSGYNRLTVKLNNTYSLTKTIKVGSSVSLSSQDKDNAAYVISQVYRAWPSSLPYNKDGSFAEIRGAGNPLASIEYNNSFYKRYSIVGNVFTNINFYKYFSFRSSYAFDISNKKQKNFTPEFYVSPTQQNIINDLSVITNERNTWLWENTLNFTLDKSDDHFLNVLAGYTIQKTKSEFLSGSVENIPDNDQSLWYLNAGDTDSQRTSNSGGIYSMISFLGRVNYSYSGKYLFTASFRTDGSSKFEKKTRWGYFPSFALGWNIDKESFFKLNSIIDKLKLRASWGQIGNEKMPYNKRFTLINSGQNAVFGSDETLYPGASLGSAANPNLRWETTIQTDIGLEISLFKNKISAEIDLFNRETNDILVAVPVPAFAGNGAFVYVYTNAADVRNQGIELYLNFNGNLGPLKASFNFNGSYIKNEVLNLAATTGKESFKPGGGLGNGQQVTRTQVGKPIGSFYGYKVIGVIQNQKELNNSAIIPGQTIGDLKFRDINGDGLITDKDRMYIGSPIPDYIFGFGFNLGYKNFTLSVDFQGQFGNDIYNGKNAVRPDLYNFEERVLKRWTGAGTSNYEPRATAGGANYSVSDYFIENGSYLRLRNVSIEYNLPKKFLEKINFNKISVYLRGTNLYTFTQFSGYSPDIGSSNVLSAGIDLGRYPVSAVGTLGISCSF